MDAPFTLYRLDDDRGGLIVHHAEECFEIAEIDLRETRHRGLETGAHLRVARRGDHRERSAVKALVERDDFPSFLLVLSAAQSRELDGGFVRFKSAVTEKRLAFECETIQPFGHVDLRRGVIGVSDGPQMLRLLGRRTHEIRMTMPEHASTEAGEQVDVFVAVHVPQLRAVATMHDDGDARVVADQHLVGALDKRLRFGFLRHRQKDIKRSPLRHGDQLANASA